MDNRERFDELLGGELDGALNEVEKAEFAALIDADPELAAEASEQRELLAALATFKTTKCPPGLVKTTMNVTSAPQANIVPVAAAPAPAAKSKLPIAIAAAASVAALLAVGALMLPDVVVEEEEGSVLLVDSVREEGASTPELHYARFASTAAPTSESEGLIDVAAAKEQPTTMPVEQTPGDLYKHSRPPAEPSGDDLTTGDVSDESPTAVAAASARAMAPATVLNQSAKSESESVDAVISDAEAAMPGDAVQIASAADSRPGRVGGGTDPEADRQDDLPFPDRITLTALMESEPTVLLADTWNQATALRFMPTAANVLARANDLPRHRYAIFRAANPARAGQLARDLNDRFPDAATAFDNTVLVMYGPTLIGVGASGIGIAASAEEFFPGRAPAMELPDLIDLSAVAMAYDGQPMDSWDPNILRFDFATPARGSVFLTAVERLFGAAAERLDTDRMELTTTPGQTTSTQTTVTIPVAPSAP